MTQLNTRSFTVADYEQFAKEYYQSLPMEHFMEARPQGTQREVALASLGVLKGRRIDVQVFNELLIVYRRAGRLKGVVPDNMVVVSTQPVRAVGSFNTAFE